MTSSPSRFPLATLACAACLLGTTASAQLLHGAAPLPTFEVATVKPSASDAAPTSFQISFQRGFTATDLTVERLIEFAFNLRAQTQLFGEPGWAGSRRFDLNAKLDSAETQRLQDLPAEQRIDQFKLMVQSLLRDRFALQTSYGHKVLPAFKLELGEGGSKLKQAIEVSGAPNGSRSPVQQHPPTVDASPGHLRVDWASMHWFAHWLSNLSEVGDRNVIDETGLTGLYGFTLRWTPDDAPAPDPSANAGPPDADGPAFPTALKEQLGLRLVPAKAPVEVLVIQCLNQPTEN